MVGVLAEVGRGKLDGGDVERLLASGSETAAHFMAPPSGPFLERVLYRGEPRDQPREPVLRVQSPEPHAARWATKRPKPRGRRRESPP